MVAMSEINMAMYEALVVANVPEAMAKAAAAQVVTDQDLFSKADLVEFGQDLRAEIDRRFAEQDKRFVEIEKSLAVLRFSVLSGGPLILGLLAKLVFSP